MPASPGAATKASTAAPRTTSYVVPYGVPQVIAIGSHEDFVPRELVDTYATAAAKAGDSVRTLFFPGAGHFEIASATQWTWPRVETAIRALLDGRLPADEKAS